MKRPGRAAPWRAGRTRGSLRRQLVVLSAAATALAVVLLVLLVQVLLDRTTSSAVDRVLDERIDAVIGSAQSATTGERLVVPDARLDAGVAVYDGQGSLIAGSAPSADAATYARLAGEAGSQTVTVEESRVVRSEPFALDGGIDGVVIVTERLTPYESAEHYALLVSSGTGLLAILASAGLAAFVSRRVLAPVLAMAATAEEWSERDLTSRFDLDASGEVARSAGSELSALGRTLDSLLDKVAAAIRSEQRLTAELAHELRTPLTTIQGTADLMALRCDLDADLREDVEELRAATRRMAETITVLLDLARSTSGSAGQSAGRWAGQSAGASSCRVTEVLDDVLADLGARRAGVRVSVDDDVRLGLPRSLAVRALGPVVDNAVRHGREVVVTVLESPVGNRGQVLVAVDDDGDGVPSALREWIFEPGHTSPEGSGHGSGHSAGLGLALARRIARTAGGDVRLDEVPPGGSGARFVVELPGV